MSGIDSAYTQIFSVGVLWISIHCAGMCGPLLIGFDVAGVHRGKKALGGALGVLTYQGGRALVYALLGAIFGLFGAGLQRYLSLAGGWLSVLFGLLLAGSVLLRLVYRAPAKGPGFSDRLVQGLTQISRPLLDAAGDNLLLRNLGLGLIMGFLPCMITIWALSLAALTGSPLHGAAIMLLLVAMTTPMLLGVTLLPRALGKRIGPLAHRLPAILMGISGLWLTVAGAASLGWIHHAHFGFKAFGRDFAMMFW